jgi:uncharacterized protein (TIGR02284 family)
MTTTTTATTDVDTLNELLRGEMSAIETYRQALEKAESNAQELKSFAKDHRDAADQLWHHVEQHGGKPSEGSGAWGSWAKGVEGTAKLFGTAAALKALKEGEEHGLKNYESALENEDMSPECLTLIRNLGTKQREHISGLDRLIAQA